MEALRIPVWLVICALIIMLIRSQRPEFALAASVGAGIISFFLLREDMASIIRWVQRVNVTGAMQNEAVSMMLKAGGIAFVSEFASDLCADAGEKALAGRIDLAERIMLTALSIPFAAQLLEQVTGLLL